MTTDDRCPDGDEDDHRARPVLVHVPQQQVEGHRREDPRRRLDEVGDDAGADESSVRQDALCGGGCIARYVRPAGRVVEREGGEDGDDEVEDACNPRAALRRRRGLGGLDDRFHWGLSFTVGVLEHGVERYPEDPGDLEGHLQGGRVAALLDGDDGLAGDADAVGQLGLRHLAVGEPERADRVGDLGRLHHDWKPRR